MSGATTWTATVTWGEYGGEEIDVVAATRREAREEVERQLREDYEPGWTITSIEPIAGGFAFSSRGAR